VLAALHAALPRLPSLRTLCLAAPPGVLPPGPLHALSAALAAAPAAARAAVLGGCHARAGRDSPLRGLPAEVLARILDLAAPKDPPHLELRLLDPLGLYRGFQGGSSSDSEDDSEDGSSNSSTSDEDNSGSSDASGSDDGDESSGPTDVAVAAAAAAAAAL
jgi:hypothetical protein